MTFNNRPTMKIHFRNPNSRLQIRRRAFTLVEMLLVITIIGILAALVIPKMVGRSEQARQTAVRADLSSIKTALDAFEVDNGYYPKSLQDLLQQPGNAKNWHGPAGTTRIPTTSCRPARMARLELTMTSATGQSK